ncbi:unnamed protein product [Ectocarpus sp. 4 AP-2014]
MLWDWLRVCLGAYRDPYASAEKCRYEEYEKDRATTVIVTHAAVHVDYAVGGLLGTGGFGLVKEGLHRQTQSKSALKFVFRKDLSKKDEELFLMEAGILTGLTHAHVVEMRGFYKWEQAYCLAMERMEGGELCEDIVRRVFYSEACARRIILQVLDALAFLHRRGIIHRDLKPENLLLVRRGSEYVKLADFGFAAVLSQPTYKVVEPVGSPGYAAAEVLRVTPYDGQADVFSLGVISFVLLSGYLPFGGVEGTLTQTVNATLEGNPPFDEVQWSAVSDAARDFVEALLSPSPSDRPTAEKAMFHPWMKVQGNTLLSRSLSDRRFGENKPLLEEFQGLQRRRLKAAVGAVVAANRLHKFLAAGHKDRGDEAAGRHGGGKEEDKPAQHEEPMETRDIKRVDGERALYGIR